MQDTPYRKFRRPDAPQGRLVSDEELARVMRAAGYTPGSEPRTGRQLAGAFAKFLFETGMRPSDAAAVTPEMIDRKKATATIPARFTKGATETVVGLPEGALAVLDDLPTDPKALADPVFRNTATGLVAALSRVVRTTPDLDPFRPHDLRYTGVRRKLMRGEEAV